MKLEDFLGRIHAHHEALIQARLAYADRLALGFSPFQFIQPDEMRLSEIIAWMLNPKGSHGQGARFLEALLSQIGIAWDTQSCINATVQTEESTHALRRIDILVKSNGRALAIENKPWADDQDKQVFDYLAYLDDLFPARHCLIYLSSDGSDPSDKSIPSREAKQRRNNRQLLTMGYKDLLPWIATCKSECRADRVTVFLDEFALYIQQHFLGIEDMNENDQIVSAITRSSEMLKSALQVIAAADSIKLSLIKKFEEQIEAALVGSGWRMESSLQKSGRWTGVSIRYNSIDNHRFRIEFETTWRSDLAYGIASAKDDPLHNKITDVVTLELGRAKSSPTWPWYRITSPEDKVLAVESDWRANEGPWLAIADGSLGKKVTDAAHKFHAILSRHGLLHQSVV